MKARTRRFTQSSLAARGLLVALLLVLLPLEPSAEQARQARAADPLSADLLALHARMRAKAQSAHRATSRVAADTVDALSEGLAITSTLVGLTETIPPTAGPLDVDGDRRRDALTDGLLVFRYLSNLITDSVLLPGVVSPGATRTTGPVLRDYLAGLRGGLDIDGNAAVEAATDGTLVMRYLFGFRGDALIAGAIAPNAARTTAAAITAYLDAFANPSDTADSDGDGLANAEELLGYEILLDLVGLGSQDPGFRESLTRRFVTSDPFRADTDGDGLDDRFEKLFRTDPRRPDSDADGLIDLQELTRYASSPTSVDSDGDARGPDRNLLPNPNYFDGNELRLYGTAPALADTDGDGDSDFLEHTFNATLASPTCRWPRSISSGTSISAST